MKEQDCQREPKVVQGVFKSCVFQKWLLLGLGVNFRMVLVTRNHMGQARYTASTVIDDGKIWRFVK